MSPYNSDTKRMRKALHASLRFYGDGVQQFEQTVHSEIDHVIARLHGTHDAVSGQDFENLVSDSILSVIHILLTGSRPEEGDPNVLNMREFDHWFSALLTPDIDILLQVAPWLRLFPCRAGHLWSLADGYKKKFLDYYFHHMKKTQSPGDQRGLVNVLLAQQQSDTDQWLSDERIQCLLLNIVTGAYLTTRSSLLGCLLFLLHYPDVQKRVQKEIDEVIGERKCRFGTNCACLTWMLLSWKLYAFLVRVRWAFQDATERRSRSTATRFPRTPRCFAICGTFIMTTSSGATPGPSDRKGFWTTKGSHSQLRILFD
ncbi:steroid 17-alpha-hydroxylase/17,20 lyase-like [Pomacea canaliculata]|uniref:steroid 17-alpha-hydroxylase/17,20 lyase-like n=1 Tax=Pomacea canaliculata TaxID=400727 RepID=UPI000D73EE0E|nr:steroid 17-alpha-hydroxylase/17,20 lyase-like [Pomacea canaliculata]